MNECQLILTICIFTFVATSVLIALMLFCYLHRNNETGNTYYISDGGKSSNIQEQHFQEYLETTNQRHYMNYLLYSEKAITKYLHGTYQAFQKCITLGVYLLKRKSDTGYFDFSTSRPKSAKIWDCAGQWHQTISGEIYFFSKMSLFLSAASPG